MYFPPDFLDQIRTRLAPSRVIGRHLRLHGKPGGEHVGLCPFHDDSKPSLTISDRKGFYHCFACGAHGDIFTFLEKHKGLSFRETVTQLAQEAGLPLPQLDPEAERRHQKRQTLHDVMEQACRWFESKLYGQEGREALAYVQQRGLSAETIRAFRLGFAPDTRQGLRQHLLGGGTAEQLVLDAGLAIKPDTGQPYDRFRGRVIFPIHDARGRVIAFGGRVLGEGEPKYLNSPETDLFHKSYVLYGFHLARDSAYRTGSVAVVEGYMDVIALHAAGIRQVVAPLGTAVTEEHIKQLWQFACDPVICLDGDAAGKRAMARAAERCLPVLEPGCSLRFASLPKGQDPDDLTRTEGARAMRAILKHALPLSDVLWEMARSEINPTTPERKAAFERKLMEYAGRIRDRTVQLHYRNHFREKLWQWNRSAKGRKKEAVPAAAARLAVTGGGDLSLLVRYEHQLINLVLRCPALLAEASVREEFTQLETQHAILGPLHHAVAVFADAEDALPDAETLRQILVKRGFSTHMDYVDRQAFLDRHADKSAARECWRYLMSCHELARMEAEYTRAVAAETERTSEHVYALKKQLDMQAKQVAKHQKALDLILEG